MILSSTFFILSASSADVGSACQTILHQSSKTYYVPSSKMTSALPIPIAMANAILCPSPPDRVDHSLIQYVLSIPHSAASSTGSTPLLIFVALSLSSLAV